MGQIALMNKLQILFHGPKLVGRLDASFPVAERPSPRRSVVMPETEANLPAGHACALRVRFILPSFVLFDDVRAC